MGNVPIYVIEPGNYEKCPECNRKDYVKIFLDNKPARSCQCGVMWNLLDEKADNINHPPHYNSGKAQCECGRKIECIDVTRYMSFDIGNAIKYLWRFEHKNGIEDLKKAVWYINDQIKKLESEK